MLNVKVGDVAIPNGAAYGGEVMAVNHLERTVTFKSGNSELADWHTLPYNRLRKLVVIEHQTQQFPIEDVDPDGLDAQGQQAWNAFQREQAFEPTWEERERLNDQVRLAYCGWEEF
jgi:hypothetical protein